MSPSARARDDERLLAAFHTAHAELDGNPGVRRIWAHMIVAGYLPFRLSRGLC